MPDAITPAGPGDDGRERAIWLAMVALGVVVVIVVLLLGWGVIGGRLAAARRIDAAIRVLKETSATTSDLDARLRSKVDTDTAIRAEQEIEALQPVLERVNAIPVSLAEGAERLTDDERRQAAVVISLANADSSVLNEGISLLQASEAGASVRLVVDPAWEGTLAADRLAAESVTEYGKHTRASVQRASKMNARAKDAYATMRSWFKGAGSTLPITDFSGYIEYITARMEALATAQKANDSWLAGDTGQAERLIAAYTASDARLKLQIQVFPAMPSDWIDTTFMQQLESPSSAYYKARQAAATGEAQLQGF